MTHEAYGELAAGYALTALAEDERSRFEEHLRAGCADCQSTLVEYAETLAAMATDLPRVPAPPAVRAQLLRRVAAQTPTRGVERGQRRIWWPALAAASLAAAAALLVYLGLTVSDLRREVAARSQEAATLRGEVTRQRELLALLGAPDTQAVALAGLAPSPEARGRMWWNESRRSGFFVASGLPAVPAGKTYQLWVISGGKPISAGIFPVDPRGGVALRVGPIPEAAAAEVFAVTLEPAGGLPAPSGQMYLAGKSS
jgi:anti-sigma-K factor RskA